MRRDSRNKKLNLRVESAPEENTEHIKIVARLYIPKNYDKMEKETKKKFDEIREILEKAPKDMYAVSVLKKHEKEDPEETVLFFGGMWCRDIDDILKYLNGLIDTPAFHLRK